MQQPASVIARGESSRPLIRESTFELGMRCASARDLSLAADSPGEDSPSRLAEFPYPRGSPYPLRTESLSPGRFPSQLRRNFYPLIRVFTRNIPRLGRAFPSSKSRALLAVD